MRGLYTQGYQCLSHPDVEAGVKAWRTSTPGCTYIVGDFDRKMFYCQYGHWGSAVSTRGRTLVNSIPHFLSYTRALHAASAAQPHA